MSHVSIQATPSATSPAYFNITVRLDRHLAHDSGCRIHVCLTHPDKKVVENFPPFKKEVNTRNEGVFVFRGVPVYPPGEYMFRATVTMSDGETFVVYSNVVSTLPKKEDSPPRLD